MAQPNAVFDYRRDKTHNRLKEALTLLACDIADPAAQFCDSGTGRTELVDAILREIDETVLPRRIVLSAKAQDIGELTIAHRRLVAIRVGREKCDTGGANPTDPDKAARFYARQIQALASAVGESDFHLARHPSRELSQTTSCTAHRLSECLKLDGAEDKLSEYLDAVQVCAVGWIRVGQNMQPTSFDGPDDIVQRLSIVSGVAGCASRNAASAARVPRISQSLLVLSMGGGMSALIASYGSETAIIALMDAVVDAAAKSWQDVFGR